MCADVDPIGKQVTGILVVTLGGGPNSAQREEGRHVWERAGRVPPMAVVTPSNVVRGIITVLNWFYDRKVVAFDPREYDEAFAYLKLQPSEANAALSAVAEMRQELGLPPIIYTGVTARAS